MTVAIAFAFIGGVILIGFFANLLFRVTKIPSVLLLMAIGVLLGPVTGLVTSGELVSIAPFFGTLALLIILFEGGLELDISSVLKQAPRATILSFLVFLISFVTVAALAFFVLHLSLLNSLLIASILGAGSPAIIIPLVSKLSVRPEIKTILKLESALGDVLLIVAVLFLLDVQASGKHSVSGIAYALFMSFAVAFVISSIAGVLWARLVGWMGKEPLAYMLTLGFVFLLYFGVEELGGSAALAVLMFGMFLENMHVVADRVGMQMRYFFGIDVRAEQFILQEFMKNITEELSFLIRTFFFVYLGLLLDFRALTPQIGLYGAAMVILLLASRWVAVRFIIKRSHFTKGELRIIHSMVPRGLATAVMAFLPYQQGLSGTELFPIYAFIVIVGTNIYMTGGVIFAEKLLKREKRPDGSIPESGEEPAEEKPGAPILMEQGRVGLGGHGNAIVLDASLADTESGKEVPPGPFSFAERMMRLLGTYPEERDQQYIQAMQSSSLGPPLFWVQMFLASVLTALGLVLNQSSIIIGAALIVPIAWPVLAAGLALAVGDIYLLLKLLVKLVLVGAMVAVLCAIFSELLPFNAVTAEIASRTRPTILDFLAALFSGMAGAALFFSKKGLSRYFPGALLGLALMPPLAVLGFGSGSEFSTEIFQGAALLFITNFFAAILGATAVYAVAGMPQTAAMSSVRAWKEREMSQPSIQFLFERLKLGGFIGRAGSTRARLMVIIVFLLALLIPLQMAFNQLSQEFRARQAIAVVEKMFDLPGRSTIVNSISNIGEKEIAVRIQVATNAFFTSEEIRRFEERVRDRTDIPTRLNLVQSLSDIGEGKKVLGMLSSPAPDAMPYKPSVRELAQNLRDEIDKNIQTSSFPQSITILRTSADLDLSQNPPSFTIEYLAEASLSDDARMLLAGMLERQMGLQAGRLLFAHVQSKYEFPLNSGAEIGNDQERKLLEIQDKMMRYPQVQAHIDILGRISEKSSNKLRQTLYGSAPLLADPSRVGITVNPDRKRMVTITLRVMRSAS